MTHHQRLLIKVATLIRGQLAGESREVEEIPLPQETWRRCQQLQRKLQAAQQRHWHLAAHRLKDDFQVQYQELLRELAVVGVALEPTIQPQQLPISEIVADLVALQEEFEQVEFDLRHETISVTTGPIELEGIYLGPFKILLEFDKLGEQHPYCYSVIALDPHPAACNDGVTHPHVQDESVCEGEGRPAIRGALRQGRLLDFFVIVANLLQNYNSGSPYVSLSDWEGVACNDCGSSVSDSERWSCEKCETSICGDCYISCVRCDGIYCSECAVRCEQCDDPCCHGCLVECCACEKKLCSICLDSNERCTDCHDNENQQEDQESASGEESETGQPDAPLQPDRLGQVAFSA
ncbi:MAG: hypothetical protein WD030_02955 [Pirellulales bacterium]